MVLIYVCNQCCVCIYFVMFSSNIINIESIFSHIYATNQSSKSQFIASKPPTKATLNHP